MYKISYAEIMDGSASITRDREREAFDYSLRMITEAQAAGVQSPEMRSALMGLQDLWGYFIADLANQDNALPQALRADLASIGRWVMQQADHVLNDRSRELAALIDVNRTVRDGLQ